MASKNRLDQAAGASIDNFFSKAEESKLEPTIYKLTKVHSAETKGKSRKKSRSE